MKWPMGNDDLSGQETLRSPFDENDRAFRVAVKRVVADVLDKIREDINSGTDPMIALDYVAQEIRNEDTV